MAGGLIDELFVALGFKIDVKEVKTFDNNLKSTLQSATRFAAAVTAAVVVVDHMATSLLKNNQAFISFNQQTGLAIGNMQRIAKAGMLANMNITPETVMQSMQAVQSNLAQIRLGQGNIEPYQLLGISPVGKDANQVFDDLRNAIKGLDDMTATNIISQMGFNPEMITVLRMTNAELEDMNGLMLSPEQRQAIEQYGMGLRKVNMELSLLKDQALLAIMPALIDFLKGFKAIAQVTYDMMDGFTKLLDLIPQLKGALAALALGILAYFNPVIAAVTALYLLIEDLAVWKAGGKSAIGTLVGQDGENITKVSKNVTENIKRPGTSDIGLDFSDWLLKKVGLPSNSEHIRLMNEAGKKGMNYQEALEYSRQKSLNYDDILKNSTQMGTGGASAQISHAQNMTQNNYMAFGGADAVPIAQKANDLMFAMMQVDRTA